MSIHIEIDNEYQELSMDIGIARAYTVVIQQGQAGQESLATETAG